MCTDGKVDAPAPKLTSFGHNSSCCRRTRAGLVGVDVGLQGRLQVGLVLAAAVAAQQPQVPGTLLWDAESLDANRRAGPPAPALEALLRVANASAGLCVSEPAIEFSGHNLDPSKRGACTDTGGGLAAASASACCDLCRGEGPASCRLWTFYPVDKTGSGRCCYKFSDAGRRNATVVGVVSGRGTAPASVTGPWSVMNKSVVAGSGDKHDYLQYASYYWPCNVSCTIGAPGVPPGPDGCSRFCDANNNNCQYTYCHSNCSCAWCNNSTSCTNPRWGVGDCTCQACNMSTGLPWVAHDGYNWPGSGHLDRGQGSDPLFNAVVPLSLAWYYTGYQIYGAKAAALLRTWFLTPATAMNPNLEHADTIPGVGPETGGVVDFARFPRILDCIRLLEATEPNALGLWTVTDRTGMRDWVKRMLEWWVTSRPGVGAMGGDRNIAMTASITAMSMALYSEQPSMARVIAANHSQRLISVLLDANGRVIADMNRPDGFMYCSADMVDLMDLAVMSNHAGLTGVDLLHWRQNASSGSVPLALEWLLPYCSKGCTAAGHTVQQQRQCSGWPYDQVTDMPFAQCKLVYRWAAKLYDNQTLLRLADAMPAHAAGAGGAEYYTYGLLVDQWVDLVYPTI